MRVMIDIESPLNLFSTLVKRFAYVGSSHRRKGAVRHIIDMVWLYRSPISAGRRLFTLSNDFYPLLSRPQRKGVSTLSKRYSNIQPSEYTKIYSVTRFFSSGFFHESVSPQPQSISSGPFRIFSKIRGDIRK